MSTEPANPELAQGDRPGVLGGLKRRGVKRQFLWNRHLERIYHVVDGTWASHLTDVGCLKTCQRYGSQAVTMRSYTRLPRHQQGKAMERD